jgi:hypothetical protein
MKILLRPDEISVLIEIVKKTTLTNIMPLFSDICFTFAANKKNKKSLKKIRTNS